jgi:hypothetical protein
MKVDKRPLKTKIEKKGQPYVDEPIYTRTKPVAAAVFAALGIPYQAQALVGYERVTLKWVGKKARECEDFNLYIHPNDGVDLR